MPFGERAMLQAAKIFAGTVVDLCQDAELMKRVRVEFRKGTKGFKYDPLVKNSQAVPVDPP
jgi:hypothetical protein